MPNLYNQSDSNIRRTWTYLFFFALLVIGVGWIISYFLQSQAILLIAVIFAILINFFSYWYSDRVVLSISRAKPVKKEDEPELYRIVENLSITAGLPMPRIFVMEEAQANAFATGRDPKHGVIVVTRGLMNRLEKVELEAVIAHELAHIGNRDVLLSTVVVVLVGMIVLITDFFFRIAFSGGGRNDKSRLIMIAIALLLAIIAPLLAQIMKMAISRRREFLADSSGSLLTRYPEGLASALEKIATDPNPMRVANDATAHLFIASPFRGEERNSWIHKLFSTHPPVDERIAKLRRLNH